MHPRHGLHVVVEPEDLVSETERHAPALIFCSEERADGPAEHVPGLDWSTCWAR
jgi:hypothetical protein